MYKITLTFGSDDDEVVDDLAQMVYRMSVYMVDNVDLSLERPEEV